MRNPCPRHTYAPVIAGRCGGCSLPTAPRWCPSGIHSLFDPCPGDCGDPVTDTIREESIAPVTTEITIDATRIMEAFARLPRLVPAPAHPDTERRTRYAAAIRDHIKALTIPAPTPGGPPMAGATEWDLADVVLLLADAELDQLRAERDRYAKALDKIGDFNKLVTEGSCRVHAADQARDTLSILEHHLRPHTAPPRPEKGQR